MRAEAVRDVEAAMDILSFALYHENTNNVSGDNQEVTKGEERPLARTVSDDEHSPAKRQRLDRDMGQDQDLKSKIWAAMEKNEGILGMANLGEYNLGDDQDMIKAAIDALADEGRIMVSDGEMFRLD